MIKKIDHFVITTKDISAMLKFYEALGFKAQDKVGRHELHAGDFKINVHTLGKELTPHAKNVRTGCGDYCFEIDGDLQLYRDNIKQKGLSIEVDIVTKHGVKGEMKSIYLRDPDGNLIEISSYD